MTDLEQQVRECISEMFVRAEIAKNAKHCACERPMAGVFDHFGWSTCQKCLNVIGRADLLRRGK